MFFTNILTKLDLDLSPEALEQEKKGKKGISVLNFYHLQFVYECYCSMSQ